MGKSTRSKVTLGGGGDRSSSTDITTNGDYLGKKSAMEIAFGKIQGLVNELKDAPDIKRREPLLSNT